MMHFSFHDIFLGILTLGGVATTIWGWLIIANNRRMRTWPQVEGIIEKSKRGMDHHDLLPEIAFIYSVNGTQYNCTQEFPGSLTPNKEFTDTYLEKYPLGAKVNIRYDPRAPGRATLEGAIVKDDWMVFWWGIGMIAIGVLFLMVIE